MPSTTPPGTAAPRSAKVLAEHPHLALSRLPSYSPQLNAIESGSGGCGAPAGDPQPPVRATMAALRRALRASPGYYQARHRKVPSLIRAPEKVAQSAAA